MKNIIACATNGAPALKGKHNKMATALNVF